MNHLRLEKDIEFIIELDQMKQIMRRTRLIREDRRENDAEHSWHIAVMAMVLSEYADESINLCHVIKMLLVHDIVEIDAGDTYCYDEKGYEDKEFREKSAADRLFGLLGGDKGAAFRALWEEFEEMNTPEARFAASMDRLQPMLNNAFSDGGSWLEYRPKKSWVLKRATPIKSSSQTLWAYVNEMLDDAEESGLFSKED